MRAETLDEPRRDESPSASASSSERFVAVVESCEAPGETRTVRGMAAEEEELEPVRCPPRPPRPRFLEGEGDERPAAPAALPLPARLRRKDCMVMTKKWHEMSLQNCMHELHAHCMHIAFAPGVFELHAHLRVTVELHTHITMTAQ